MEEAKKEGLAVYRLRNTKPTTPEQLAKLRDACLRVAKARDEAEGADMWHWLWRMVETADNSQKRAAGDALPGLLALIDQQNEAFAEREKRVREALLSALLPASGYETSLNGYREADHARRLNQTIHAAAAQLGITL